MSADEIDDLAVHDNPISAAFGKLGAVELQAMELPKAWKMSRCGGGLVRLAIQRMNQCGGQAELELRRLHIPIVNRDFDKYNLYLEVEKAQASWAEYVLLRAGYIVTSKPVDPRNAEWAAGKGRVPAWSEKARAMRVGRGRSRQRVVVIRREPRRGLLARLVDWIVGGA